MADFRNGGTNRFSGGHGGHGGGFKGRGGDRGGFGGNKFGGNRPAFDRNRGPVTMHQAVCDQCKKPCEVPFVPTAGKPVYCNACFGGKKEVGFGRDNRNQNAYKTPPRTDFGVDIKKVSGEEIKKQIEALNVKIDRLARLIEEIKPAKITVPAVKIEKEEKEIKINPPTQKSFGEAKKKVAKVKKTSKK